MAMTWTRIEVGLVLQGGGALGAYEWGAIEALFRRDGRTGGERLAGPRSGL
jgi:predicted acylesterase/phospholipase RssA